jgi:uncharacterized protein (UPF0332 family)
MTLKQWEENSWLRAHKTSKEEIGKLLGIVERDLTAARTGGLSADWRFGIAYNAALKLCTILLYASGYRPEKNQAHYRTLQALPEILGDKCKRDAKYLDDCRVKRNTAEYDYVDVATDADTEELLHFAEELKREVMAWLGRTHPALCTGSK